MRLLRLDKVAGDWVQTAGIDAFGQGDFRRRHGDFWRGHSRGGTSVLVGCEYLLKRHSLNLNRSGWARLGASGLAAFFEPIDAHVALGDHAALGLEARHAIRAVPSAVLAANADISLVNDDAALVNLVGINRAALGARGIQAVVAAARKEKAQCVGILAALDLADAPPLGIYGQAILFTTGHLAGVAADAEIHVEVEARLGRAIVRAKTG